MSALIAHAKAFEALADSLWEDGESFNLLKPGKGDLLIQLAGTYRKAAGKLREIAKAEAGGQQ